MRKNVSGFTIVELLIVIVVIGILAAIVIVAYNGIQTQANNTKTMSAVESWAKAIKLYEVKNNGLPSIESCLGSPTTYPDNGYCWDGTYWDVKSTFLTAMDPFISTYPEPSVGQISSSNLQRRGAFYHIDGAGVHAIRVMLTGVSSCPASSAGQLHASSANSNGMWCEYRLD